MLTIHKFAFDAGPGRYTVSMPRDAILLSVQQQEGLRGSLSLWALVETAEPIMLREVVVVGTGVEAPRGATYVATAQDRFGYVWHVFDKGQS